MDAHVGLRIRMARMAKGASQTELGRHLGVTFQQVQKYEKGVNRVGAGRLSDIARFLSVPVTFFYEGSNVSGDAQTSERLLALTRALNSEEGMKIARALERISDPLLKRRVVRLVQAIAYRTDSAI